MKSKAKELDPEWRNAFYEIGSGSAALGILMAASISSVPGAFRARYARAYNHMIEVSKELTSILSEITGEESPPHPEPIKEDY